MHFGELYLCLCSCSLDAILNFVRYDFDSWREFSYLDEENLESAQR